MGCRDSSSSLSCCPEKEFVQDKVCNPWSTAVAGSVVVYTNNINQNIYGTGYLQFSTGPANITLEVLNSAGTVIGTQAITPGSSVAFTYRRFTTIRVVIVTVGQYEGEFCITTRYPVE